MGGMSLQQTDVKQAVPIQSFGDSERGEFENYRRSSLAKGKEMAQQGSK